LSDALFDSYSDSQLKKWADEKGLKVPQGSKRNEVLALVRRHNARLNSQASSLSSSGASAYGAATSSAGNEYSRATDTAAYNFENIQSAVYSYLDWAKYQVGLAASTASASGSSATRAASKSASSVSKSASSAASSASKAASSSARSAKQEL
jgi:Putative nuclear envelope organisation protein